MTIKESNGAHFDRNTGKQEPIYCPCNGRTHNSPIKFMLKPARPRI